MFSSLSVILKKAQRGRYAVGAFNINNLEILQAVLAAGERLRAPLIMSTSEGALRYAGLSYLHSMVSTAAQASSVPVVLHLDHGLNLSVIKACIRQGYSSVMYDGSHLSFSDNVRNTKKVVSLAHAKHVSVEAELGTIGGIEDYVSARRITYTDPERAREFVDRTGVDALAVALGTSHGIHKFVGTPHIDIHRLKNIQKLVKIPLVLHGASEVPQRLVRQANTFGARITHARGVPDTQIRAAVRNGICKVNEDTDLRLAFIASVRKTLTSSPAEFDPRNILGPAREKVRRVVEDRIRLLGSRGRA